MEQSPALPLAEEARAEAAGQAFARQPGAGAEAAGRALAPLAQERAAGTAPARQSPARVSSGSGAFATVGGAAGSGAFATGGADGIRLSVDQK